jgi:NAD+ kinase
MTIELMVEAKGDHVAETRGDGLIIATTSGTTAHDLPIARPILRPIIQTFVLTPICPPALTADR